MGFSSLDFSAGSGNPQKLFQINRDFFQSVTYSLWLIVYIKPPLHDGYKVKSR